MSATTGTFLIIGGFALVLLVLALLGAGGTHFGHFHVGHFHVGHPSVGHAGAAGGVELSLPAIAGFLGTFGFGAAIVSSVLPGRGTFTVLVAVAGGLVAAVPAAWLTGRLVSSVMNMPTDATLTSGDLVGASGVVITPVPVDGFGEVRLAIAGQQIKFNARCTRPLPLGTAVFVIAVPSPTSVLVEPLESIL